VQKLGPEGFKAGDEFQFTVPVGPQFLLVGERKPGPDSRTMVRPQDVQQANALLMERAEKVYASFQSKELQAEFDQMYKTRPPSIRKLPEEYLRKASLVHGVRSRLRLLPQDLRLMTGKRMQARVDMGVNATYRRFRRTEPTSTYQPGAWC
jgi:hypothetical protein